MVMMRHRRSIDEARLRAAILEAEDATDGSIGVSVAPYFWGDVRGTAHRALARQGSSGAASGNAVLFFVVPARREFVVLGGADTHERLGQDVWDAIAAGVQEDARTGDLTSALVHGIKEVGRHLAVHFPRSDSPVRRL